MPKQTYFDKLSRGHKKDKVAARFWKKVDQHTAAPCWLWTKATRQGFGYGQFSLYGYPEYAHRVAYWLHYGCMPKEFIRHTCDNPLCVNPAHFLIGTQKENIQDMVLRGRDAFIGERNPQAVLTEKDVLLLRKRYTLGARIRDLVEMTGFNRATIQDACNYRTWKHVA